MAFKIFILVRLFYFFKYIIDRNVSRKKIAAAVQRTASQTIPTKINYNNKQQKHLMTRTSNAVQQQTHTHTHPYKYLYKFKCMASQQSSRGGVRKKY